MLHHHLTAASASTAPTLLLGPSLGTTLDVWEPQLTPLSRHFNVIRWDLPGHGGSPASDLLPAPAPTLATLGALVLELLDTLRVDTAAYAGISLGGAVGAWLAAHHPERVASLALICSSAHFGPPEPWRERAKSVRSRGVGHLADTAPGRWFTPRFPAPPHLLNGHRRVDPAAYAACCDILAGLDLRADLPRIAAPTLVVAGRDDLATPPPHARELADGIPDAQLVELPRAAHLANVEQPEAVRDALLGHLIRDHPGSVASRGEGARRAVLGDAHVDRALARTTPFTARFQDFITRYAWGEIWGRDTLDRRTRSAVTLTALVAGGHKDELALHVRGALRNGLSPDEIAEVLLQCAVYCSVPAANSAFAIAEQVISTYQDDDEREEADH
ncbi:bifunctional 3-oxoadipate enol-lactonase/4-carboxymuconolactone decarboxylase PcaDC [Streptomyces sp. NBC_01431]|uniref:bifunctional 3-oxoadipate enol-lactonase/4-carboxymuconolactone decarboxylase PcaDC n=1 Tax=Streptomyces sp. NBC_01431 TaxID=2903863 RepID=UPI002E35238F|nr:alpha/beta fold hydrolase [Streptomyces sp. NBC_01431]